MVSMHVQNFLWAIKKEKDLIVYRTEIRIIFRNLFFCISQNTWYFEAKNFCIKYTILFMYMCTTYLCIKYFLYIFMYALGDINFAEYVVQSFILSRRTYVNKIIDSFCLLLFIYLAGIH
jgi:hypothetical protein